MVIDKLLGALSADGVFFLGHAERLHGMRHGLRAVIPTVYSASPTLGARRSA